METTKKNGSASLIDKGIDFIFSHDARKWLLLIVVLGFLLRVIVASNVPPVADEMVHGTHAIGVSKLAPLSTMAQAQIWYYLTDYGYRLFDVHLLTARLLSVLFGTLSIILVYLLANLLFNDKRAGLVAAFLLAISIFHITWASSYQDETMMFFVLLASYFLIKEYKEKKTISLLSAAFLGVALLTKIITGAFIIVFGFFILFVLYMSYKKDKRLFRTNIKRTLLFGLIIAISLLPILSYNYFLYKDKGIVDLAFAQFLRINAEFYTGPGLAHGEGFVLHKLPHNLYTVITHYFLKEDALSFILGLFGIGYVISRIRKGNEGEIFLLGMFFFILVFIASAIVLNTHYTSFFPLFSIFSAGFVVAATNKLSNRTHYKYVLYGGAIIMLCFTLYSLQSPLTSQSALEKVRVFTIESIDQNTLVIVDARIYRGTIAWAFNDKHYAESGYIEQIISASSKSPQRVPTKTVFIECVSDDCGWGTVKDQPEFNQSVENIVSAFSNASVKTTNFAGGGSIKGVREAEIRGEPLFRAYETTIAVDPSLLLAIDATHSHFFYHIPRDENPKEAFDYYTVEGGLDSLLNLFSYGVLYAFILLAILSLGLPFYLLLKQK